MGYPPKTQNLFIKNCVLILTCLNFSHLQSTLHLMQYLSRRFSTAQNSFWTWFWGLLVLLLLCVSPCPSAKCFPFRTFFIQGNKEKVTRNKIGAWRSCLFLVKNCWTLRAVWAGGLLNHPSWVGQMCWGNLEKKNSLRLSAASHKVRGTVIQMGSWNTQLEREACTTRGLPSRI